MNGIIFYYKRIVVWCSRLVRLLFRHPDHRISPSSNAGSIRCLLPPPQEIADSFRCQPQSREDGPSLPLISPLHSTSPVLHKGTMAPSTLGNSRCIPSRVWSSASRAEVPPHFRCSFRYIIKDVTVQSRRSTVRPLVVILDRTAQNSHTFPFAGRFAGRSTITSVRV